MRGGGLAGRARAPYTPSQGGTHGRQDTEATPEAEEAEDADGRNPLGRALHKVLQDSSASLETCSTAGPASRPVRRAQAPAVPVLPGASSGTAAAHPGQVPDPGSKVGISSCQRPWTG